MPGLKSLSDEERAIVLECIRFVSEGGLFDMEADCSVLIGISPVEFELVLIGWPDIDDQSPGNSGFLVINNCLNEVCHGPDSPGSTEWSTYFSVPREKVIDVYHKWARPLGMDVTGVQ